MSENQTSTISYLEELKSILEQKKCKDEASISIYDVLNLLRIKYKEHEDLNKNLCCVIADRIPGINTRRLNVNFDCHNTQLMISYKNWKNFFTKKNDDLIIANYWQDSYGLYYAKDMLNKCGEEISERYDKCIEDIDFYREHIYNIKSTNSSFIINSNKYDVNIKWPFSYGPLLSANIYNYEYKYDFYSNNIITFFRNNEDEIFKRVFIKIDDCPKWTHEVLYRIRKKQLEKQEIKEHKEMKKQKFLELGRRLNPLPKK